MDKGISLPTIRMTTLKETKNFRGLTINPPRYVFRISVIANGVDSSITIPEDIMEEGLDAIYKRQRDNLINTKEE
jgi:hypothetical protein